MRSVIWLLLLATVAVVAAVTFGRNDGLVSIFWGGWRTDLSLNLAVLLLLGGFAIVGLAWQALASLVSLPRRAGQWRGLRRERAAHAALREAMSEFYGGRYGRSHKAAMRALQLRRQVPDEPTVGLDREFAVLAQALAAGSLHRIGDRTRRDAQLAQLDELLGQAGGHRRADDGARLLAAEWALDDRDHERALQRLAELPPGAARRTLALRLKLRATQLAGRPLEALHTARLLAHHQAFSAETARSLTRTLAIEALAAARDGDQLQRVWRQLDVAERADVVIVCRAAQQAASMGVPAMAREWLQGPWERIGSLSADEREAAAVALSHALDGIGADWLPRLEAAARTHAFDAPVVAAVALALAERQLWGRARSMLDASARSAAVPAALRRRAWTALARLAREEADEARARECEQAATAVGT